MRNKVIIASISVILVALLGTLWYLNSDLRVNRILDKMGTLVTIGESTFRVRTVYAQGQMATRIESSTADTESYDGLNGWLGENDSILTVSYLDKEGFPVYSIPFSKRDIVTAENGDLKATKASRIPKKCLLEVDTFSLNARRIIVRE